MTTAKKILGSTMAMAIATAAHSAWPFSWDFASRSDAPVAARVGPGGDLWLLAESAVQGLAFERAVLLRIDRGGNLLWGTEDPGLFAPSALALRPDGSALAIGVEVDGTFRATAFAPDGTIRWSRRRPELAPDSVFSGPHAEPIWDEVLSAWRVPAGIEGDLAVVSFGANGEALPELRWSPPAGTGRANSLLLRPGGGLLLAGTIQDSPPPGWWVVAFDAKGTELWRHFESGAAPAGAFGGAVLLSTDPVRLWAVDETACGIFSLLLWALDAATGAPIWDTTWPPPGDCDSFTPYTVALAGDRIFAGGLGDVDDIDATQLDPIALAVNATNGEVDWARTVASPSFGIDSALVVGEDGILLASSHFPPGGFGTAPLSIAAWSLAGRACVIPSQPLPARVPFALAQPATGGGAAIHRLLVGGTYDPSTAEDVLVQRVVDACSTLFADGFDSGGTRAWSLTTP